MRTLLHKPTTDILRQFFLPLPGEARATPGVLQARLLSMILMKFLRNLLSNAKDGGLSGSPSTAEPRLDRRDDGHGSINISHPLLLGL